MAKFFGRNFPFFKGTSILGQTTKVLPRQEDTRLIVNDFIQLLMTIPGERWFRPSDGAGIPTFLFDPSDANSYDKIKEAIFSMTSRYEPRLILSDVQIEDDTKNTAKVKIFGRSVLDATNKDTLLTTFIIPVVEAV